jgi:hypothetical protein
MGFDADERVYLPSSEMLRQIVLVAALILGSRLGFGTFRLLTNNPEKVAALERYGIRVVEQVPRHYQVGAFWSEYGGARTVVMPRWSRCAVAPPLLIGRFDRETRWRWRLKILWTAV